MIRVPDDSFGTRISEPARRLSDGEIRIAKQSTGFRMKRIAYSKAALKTLSRIPANVSALIRSKIVQYAADPAAQVNNVKALRGEPGILRLRVGDWRVLFTEDGEIVAIIRIAPRGDAYN